MAILKKGSKLFSIWNMKCPRCNEGDLFDTGSFSFQKPFDMPKRCPTCNQTYMPEPGFYYGAMFISYILTGWFSLFFAMFFHWILDWGLFSTFALLILILGIFFVWIFRFSRSVWISVNVKYNPNVLSDKGNKA